MIERYPYYRIGPYVVYDYQEALLLGKILAERMNKTVSLMEKLDMLTDTYQLHKIFPTGGIET